MTTRLTRVVGGLGAFLWDFVVGDDWVGAFGVAVLLGAGAAFAHLAHVRAWWLLPPGVALVLAATVRRAARAATAHQATAKPVPARADAHPARNRPPHS